MTEVFRPLAIIRRASEAQIVSRRIRSVLTPSGATISITISLCAHERSSLFHLLITLRWTLWIIMHDQSIVPYGPIIGSPLPDVSHNILESKWSCGE